MFQGHDSEIVVYYLAGSTFVFFLVGVIIIYIYMHHKKVSNFLIQIQQDEIKRQEDVFIAMNDGEERERIRISEELHDGVCAKLSGLNMNLDYLVATLGDDQKRVLAEKTFSGIHEIINELRDISHNLLPASISDKTMQSLLIEYLEQFNAREGCRYNLYFEGSENRLNKILKSNCYRIVTELLLNIYKHANATNASIQVTIADEKIELIVEDDGCGFEPGETLQGIGLENIANRINASKGTINVDSSRRGTTIIAQLPLSNIQ